MKSIAYIVTNSGTINILVDGKMHSVPSDHMNYRQIVEALKNKEYDNLNSLIDVTEAINLKGNGKITVEDGEVLYKGSPVHNVVTTKILDMITEALPFEFLMKFLENCIANPNQKAVQELYDFLERNTLPITDDGSFLAYKRVRKDYKDIHSGSFSNRVGNIVKMDRKACDPNKNVLCSTGLHFCSMQYLPQFGSDNGDRTVIVKINPKNVTSFPTDYCGKGRCCEYLVIADHKEQTKNDILKTQKVATATGKYSLRDAQGHFVKWSDWKPRDAKGHFIKKSLV